MKHLALVSSNTNSDPETHQIRYEDTGVLVALGLTTHIETRLDFQV